jgi:flavin reductase (DIM6/NTAB) family NADH-FMN oxidoreductase RutF
MATMSELDLGRRTAPPVDPATFKDLMAGFPSGVVIVTTRDGEDRPAGLTCSSLCGLSLDPPLLLVCVGNRGRTLAAIRERGIFAVNFLAERGRRLAERFASGLADPFDGTGWSRTPRCSLPAFPGDSHAIAECELEHTVVAGDHTIVIGLVRSADLLPHPGWTPLLHGLRRYAAYPTPAEDGR